MTELIWRVDFGDGSHPAAQVWLQHDGLKNRPGGKRRALFSFAAKRVYQLENDV